MAKNNFEGNAARKLPEYDEEEISRDTIPTPEPIEPEPVTQRSPRRIAEDKAEDEERVAKLKQMIGEKSEVEEAKSRIEPDGELHSSITKALAKQREKALDQERRKGQEEISGRLRSKMDVMRFKESQKFIDEHVQTEDFQAGLKKDKEAAREEARLARVAAQEAKTRAYEEESAARTAELNRERDIKNMSMRTSKEMELFPMSKQDVKKYLGKNEEGLDELLSEAAERLEGENLVPMTPDAYKQSMAQLLQSVQNKNQEQWAKAMEQVAMSSANLGIENNALVQSMMSPAEMAFGQKMAERVRQSVNAALLQTELAKVEGEFKTKMDIARAQTLLDHPDQLWDAVAKHLPPEKRSADGMATEFAYLVAQMRLANGGAGKQVNEENYWKAMDAINDIRRKLKLTGEAAINSELRFRNPFGA